MRDAPVPHMTPESFRELGTRMIDWIAAYWERVERLPVLSPSRPGDVLARLPLSPPAATPRESDEWDAIFRDLDALILPGLTHWQSPNFFAYFPANASGPAVLGEMLSAGLGVQGMLWATSPACTELEIRVLDWLAELLGLPAHFLSTSAGGGVIQGTASEATLTALVAARHRARRATGADLSRLTLYASTQAHSSFAKAAMVAGLADGPDDSRQVRPVAVDGDCRMRSDLLAAAIRADAAAGRVPCFVLATLGTTGTLAVDPLHEIASAIDAAVPPGAPARPWLHIDAAHAGAACVCPEHRGMLVGVEHADSFCFNPHKWLLTNFDCDCFWVRDRAALTAALSVTPEYLRNPASDAGAVTDFRDWHVPLGRRFRALKLWFVVRHYGVEGLRAYIREHVRLAELFESLIRADGRFEIAAPRSLNLVCFRLVGDGPDADARNRELMRRLNASGKLFLSHTVLPSESAIAPSRVVLRLAVGSPVTREDHVRAAWDLIRADI